MFFLLLSYCRCKIACIVVFLFSIFILLAAVSCFNNPAEPEPFQPDFYLSSITFTGDSTGESRRQLLTRSSCENRLLLEKGVPFCQYTVCWNSAIADSVLSYSLRRSTSPEIYSDSSGVIIIGTTTDTVFVDSNSMEWGTTYYYAVSALKSDSTILWSDEGSILTPSSPLPTPSEISAVDLLLGRSLLSWTVSPDEDFYSYTLLRDNYQGMHVCDTLGVFYGSQDSIFTDSILPTYVPRYYKVVTTNASGFSSESNVLCYYPGSGLPWRVHRYWEGPYEFHTYSVSGILKQSLSGDYIYFKDRIRQSTYWYRITRMSTSTTSNTSIYSDEAFCDFVHASQQGALLTSKSISEYLNAIELRDEFSLELLDSLEVDFECSGMLAFPVGGNAIVHPEGSSVTYVLDIQQMELVDTLSYSFTSGQILDGYGSYVWGESGGLRRIDETTLDVAASSLIDVMDGIIVSSQGELCVISTDGVFHRLNSETLSENYSVPLPGSPLRSALVEYENTVYAYLWENPSEPMTVYNTENLTCPGQVTYKEGMEQVAILGVISIQKRNEIWCSYLNINEYDTGLFSIAN